MSQMSNHTCNVYGSIACPACNESIAAWLLYGIQRAEKPLQGQNVMELTESPWCSCGVCGRLWNYDMVMDIASPTGWLCGYCKPKATQPPIVQKYGKEHAMLLELLLEQDNERLRKQVEELKAEAKLCGSSRWAHGAGDFLQCSCGHTISGEDIAALGQRKPAPPTCTYDYCPERALMADECQRLRDENRDVLAENGRLRRELERCKR